MMTTLYDITTLTGFLTFSRRYNKDGSKDKLVNNYIRRLNPSLDVHILEDVAVLCQATNVEIDNLVNKVFYCRLDIYREVLKFREELYAKEDNHRMYSLDVEEDLLPMLAKRKSAIRAVTGSLIEEYSSLKEHRMIYPCPNVFSYDDSRKMITIHGLNLKKLYPGAKMIFNEVRITDKRGVISLYKIVGREAPNVSVDVGEGLYKLDYADMFSPLSEECDMLICGDFIVEVKFL